MKSYKKLLVSVLVSALCHSGVSALSTGGKIGVGVSATSVLVGITALCFKNCKADTHMKNDTEKKIRELIDEGRYETLKKLNIKKAKSMKINNVNNHEWCELVDNEKVNCLVEGKGEYASGKELVSGFTCGEVIDIINNCLKPVTQGLQNVNSISHTGESRFQGFTYAVGEGRYSVLFEASLSAVQFKYHSNANSNANSKGCVIYLHLK